MTSFRGQLTSEAKSAEVLVFTEAKDSSEGLIVKVALSSKRCHKHVDINSLGMDC